MMRDRDAAGQHDMSCDSVATASQLMDSASACKLSSLASDAEDSCSRHCEA